MSDNPRFQTVLPFDFYWHNSDSFLLLLLRLVEIFKKARGTMLTLHKNVGLGVVMVWGPVMAHFPVKI